MYLASGGRRPSLHTPATRSYWEDITVPAVRNVALLIGLLALALLAYWPSAKALWNFWEQNPYLGGHGPLIVAVSLALIVRSRHALAATQLRPSAAGAAGLFLGSLAWFIAWRAGVQELQLVLLPLVLLLSVLAAFGREAARIAAFPLGFVYFAEPPWHALISSLQELTIHAVGLIAPILGMPVTIAGNVLYFPRNVSFEVTPLCGGVNFLIVGLAGAALIGELQEASLRRRAWLIVSMALLMIVSNWVRVLVIIIAGYTSEMRHVLATRGHWWLGWILFALVMFGFALLAARRSSPAAPALRKPSFAEEP
jgi:exosortase